MRASFSSSSASSRSRLAVELVLPHLQVDVDSHFAGLELLLPPPDVLDSLLDECLVVVQALLTVLDPPSGLRGRLCAEEVAVGFDDLPLALGEELLFGAEPVAAVGGEALAFRDLGLGLDDLGRAFAQLTRLLSEGEGSLLESAHTVALIGTDGNIDWYCCPSFDSPSVFASILDKEKGGHYRIAPVAKEWTPKQLYFPDTNVLITRFLTEEGVGEIQGFMPIADSKEDIHRHRLIRRVEGVRGEMRFRVEMQPRFNYGRDKHEIAQYEHGVVFRSPTLCLALQATTPVACDETGIHCEFTVRAGSSVTFVLERVEPDYVPREYSEARRAPPSRTRSSSGGAGSRAARTADGGARGGPLGAHPQAPDVRPERRDRRRPDLQPARSDRRGTNWDYRYTWIRDAAFTLYCAPSARLHRGGGRASCDWLVRTLPRGGRRLARCRSCTDRRRSDLSRGQLAHLDGYRGSRPVRIGNAASAPAPARHLRRADRFRLPLQQVRQVERPR